MIKKKITKWLVRGFFITFGVGGIFQSCNYLDIDPYINDMFNLDTVFSKKEYALKYLYNVYSYLPDNGLPRSRPWVPIADECVCTYRRAGHAYNYFATNEWQASDEYHLNKWPTFYEGIRKANTFLYRINECDELTSAELREWTAEAQFLKAYFYFELMLQYGPVVIVPDKPVDLDQPLDEMLLPRNTWDECAEYVEQTMRKAMEGLPSTREASNLGKPTQASALAVLSRLTLYSASKLFNGNIDYSDFINKVTGQPYFNQVYSEEKWAKAAAVAKELVTIKPNDLHTVPAQTDTPHFPHNDQATYPDGVGGIDPYHSYIDMFNGETLGSNNQEILFSRSKTDLINGGYLWLKYMCPKAMDGFGSFAITQALVDAYYMVDGHTIADASAEYPHLQTGYSTKDSVFSGYTLKAGVHNWYINREMRFYATVGFCNSWYQAISGSKSEKKNFKVSFYKNGNSGKNTVMQGDNDKDDYCTTGYLCRKFLHPEDSYVEGGNVRHKIWIYYRMAEVYLNYVEAMNELTGTYTIGNITVSRDPAEMKKYFNLIRFRAGLPGITDTDVADVSRMRDLIARERQIEFAWEGLRYFDVRRNKTAEYYENQPVMGCNINVNDTEADKYYVKTVDKERSYIKKVFTKRQNFWPIPKYEVDKNPRMDQNPGW